MRRDRGSEPHSARGFMRIGVDTPTHLSRLHPPALADSCPWLTLRKQVEDHWARSPVVLESERGPEGKALALRGHIPWLTTQEEGGWRGSEWALNGVGLRTRVLLPGSKDNTFLLNLKVYTTVPSVAGEGEDFVVNF